MMGTSSGVRRIRSTPASIRHPRISKATLTIRRTTAGLLVTEVTNSTRNWPIFPTMSSQEKPEVVEMMNVTTAVVTRV